VLFTLDCWGCRLSFGLVSESVDKGRGWQNCEIRQGKEMN